MPFPEIKFCIVCETIRQEVGNKLTILGFYGLLPDVHVHQSPWGVPVVLTFLLGVGRNEEGGKYTLAAKVLAPDRSILVETPPGEILVPRNKGEQGYFALGFSTITFQQPGQYTFVVDINGDRTYESSFSVTPRPPSASRSPSVSASPSA
jgi:hypothetical protein